MEKCIFFLKIIFPPSTFLSHTYTYTHTFLASFFFLPPFRPLLVDLAPRFRSTLQVHAPPKKDDPLANLSSFLLSSPINPRQRPALAKEENFRSYPIYRVGTIFPSSEDGFDPSTYLFANFVDTDDNLRSNLMTINTIGSS